MTSVLYSSGLNYQGGNPIGREVRALKVEVDNLKKAIEEYARREDFALQGTFVMDGSRRSSKRNAFFTGFGRFRKLVLFDTLIEKHTTDELMAIVAHEMGHFKLGHIPRMIALSVLTQGLMFWGVGLFFVHPDSQEWVRTTLLLPESTLAASLLLLTLFYAPVGRVLSVVSLWISRRHEFQADLYSSQTYGKPAALISALRALERDHLSHPDPHPLKVWMDYSHPPVSRRARALGVDNG
jgi:STE24 endopeptidase